jgi:hypothetical protein
VALAIDASTPATAVQSTGTTATVVTASFTPPAGSVILVRYSANTIDPTSPGTPGITDSLGTPLTYTLWDNGRQPDSPTADGQVATWTARVTSSAAMTITVTNGAASPNRHAALRVVVITGADVSSAISPVGAHGKQGATASTSSIAQSYTASATSGWGFLVACDWADVGAETAGTGCTLEGSADVATNYVYAFIRRTTADDTSGVTNTLNATLPAGSTSLRWAWVEIVPAAATLTYPPSRPARRLTALPRLTVQPAIRVTTPVRAQVNPPIPVQEVDQTRRLRGMFYRRGHLWQAVRAQVNPPIPVQEVDQTRRLRGLFYRRGKVVNPVPAQVVLTAPAYPYAEVVQPRRLRGLLARRGKTLNPVPAQVTTTGNIAFDNAGSTAVNAGTTSTSVDITSAAVGAWCYLWVALGVNSGTVTATGWTSLLDADEGTAAHYALLRRQKQAGDTTFTVGWTTSTKGTLGWASYTGLDPVTPDEGATLATNGTVGRTAVPTPSATPTAANRWAVTFVGVRTTTVGNKPISWTPDAADTERLDVDNNTAGSAPWVGVEIADTNSAVTQAAHSYTATHNASESHDGSAILFLIPGQAAVTAGVPLGIIRHRVTPAWSTLAIAARSRFVDGVTPQTPVTVQANIGTKRLRGLRIGRGRTVNPVPAQVTVTAPAFPYGEVVQPRRLRGLLARRGKTFTPVPAQVVLTAPAYPYAEVVQPRRLRGLLARRGKSTTVYPAVTAPANPAVPPGPIRHLARLVTFLRRGRLFRAFTDERPVTVQPRRRPAVPFIRRGRVYRPIGFSAPPIPPAYIPQVVRAKWAKPFSRRGRVVVYLFPGVAGNPCTVLRPSTGVTGRPGSGTTSRPGTGSTAYLTGMTARPNTGTTEDPC